MDGWACEWLIEICDLGREGRKEGTREGEKERRREEGKEGLGLLYLVVMFCILTFSPSCFTMASPLLHLGATTH